MYCYGVIIGVDVIGNECFGVGNLIVVFVFDCVCFEIGYI